MTKAPRPFTLFKAGIVAGVLALSAPAFAWDLGTLGPAPNTPRKILKVHTEYKNGAPYSQAYFLGTNEAIALTNLGNADVQAIKKVLDDAFAQNKLISWIEDISRGSTTAMWYNADDAHTMVTFYYIYSGDSVLVRVKP